MIMAIGKYIRLNLYCFARNFFNIKAPGVNFRRNIFNNNSLQALFGHLVGKGNVPVYNGKIIYKNTMFARRIKSRESRFFFVSRPRYPGSWFLAPDS